MNITIHRGTDQIGGCITEYEHNGWRLFVDYGEQLPGAPVTNLPLKIEGLNCGDISKSILLITHYHGDHIGKIAELPQDLPIYMGELAKEIELKTTIYTKSKNPNNAKISERLGSVKIFVAGEKLLFGDFNILPIMVDHSAFDAYAFLIDDAQTKVFHTGDFRTHGFRSRNIDKLLDSLVGKVDYVVCEATNVERAKTEQISEHDLQEEFIKLFRENKYNIVYLSSTNIDRLFSVYHAALRAHRPFYVDKYQKAIMDIIVNCNHVWGKSRLYKYCHTQHDITLHRDFGDFRVNQKFYNTLAKKGYVLLARANDSFDKLIQQIPDADRKIYYSMWSGYINPETPAYNQKLAKSLGQEFCHLHTSGHCDIKGLEKVLTHLDPKCVIPIHTDNPEAFAKHFNDKWPVILIKDGEKFAT